VKNPSQCLSLKTTGKEEGCMKGRDREGCMEGRDNSLEEMEEICLELIQRQDVVKVLPGQRIPTDGIIVSGESYVDECMITGEEI
jgi:P-type E1-E2 ATPase